MLEGDEALSRNVILLLNHPDSNLAVSVASFWEMTIKVSLGKLKLSQPLSRVFREVVNLGIEVWPVLPEQLLLLEKLPFHHSDPFDRLIIAQALHQQVSVIGKDPAFVPYEISVLW